MKVFQSKFSQLAGTNYSEVYPLAFGLYKQLKRKSKRRPYLRSAYFKKSKIFLDYFWSHLHQKNLKDKARRLKLYCCALDLIKNCKVEPSSKEDPNRYGIILHRFAGVSADKQKFFLQIKENKNSDEKVLISVFPWE